MDREHHVGEVGFVFSQSPTPLLASLELLVQSVVAARAPGAVAIGFMPIFATNEEALRWDYGVDDTPARNGGTEDAG
jgi:hypothetical protein